MQLEIPLETVVYAAKLAFDAGIKVILNPAPATKITDELLSMLFMITPNETEAGMIFFFPFFALLPQNPRCFIFFFARITEPQELGLWEVRRSSRACRLIFFCKSIAQARKHTWAQGAKRAFFPRATLFY